MAYVGIGNQARKITNLYVGIDGEARKVKKAYIGVNGMPRLWWGGGEDPVVPGDYPMLKAGRIANVSTSRTTTIRLLNTLAFFRSLTALVTMGPNGEEVYTTYGDVLDAGGRLNVKHITSAPTAFVETYVIYTIEVDSWPMDVDETGAITCYQCQRNITAGNYGYTSTPEHAIPYAFFLVGNGSGGIKANPDSSYLFDSVANGNNATGTSGGIYGLGLLDTSEVVNMEGMFANCYLFANEFSLSSLNTSKVTNMKRLFENCTIDVRYSDTLDLNCLDVSNVTSLSYMFSNFRFIEGKTLKTGKIEMSQLDTSHIRDTSYMFSHCWQLKREAIEYVCSTLDTSGVIDMTGMFSQCSRVTTLDLRNLDISSVLDMSKMFQGCTMLVNVYIHTWNTSKVLQMSHMFEDCGELTNIYVDLAKWVVPPSEIQTVDMFKNCGTTTVTQASPWI